MATPGYQGEPVDVQTAIRQNPAMFKIQHNLLLSEMSAVTYRAFDVLNFYIKKYFFKLCTCKLGGVLLLLFFLVIWVVGGRYVILNLMNFDKNILKT